MTLTIIIATYNSEKYLDKCLESIAIQSYPKIELIIIDNCSTDSTLNIINKYNLRINLRVFSEPDSGIYDALNKGVVLASGEYILFLGSDDYLYEPQTIENIFFTLPKYYIFDIIHMHLHLNNIY